MNKSERGGGTALPRPGAGGVENVSISFELFYAHEDNTTLKPLDRKYPGVRTSFLRISVVWYTYLLITHNATLRPMGRARPPPDSDLPITLVICSRSSLRSLLRATD